MTLRSTITTALTEAAGQLLARAGAAWPEGLEVRVTQPARLEHGDYSSTLPLQLARALRRPPLQIASELAVAAQALPVVARVAAVPPGHLNLFLDWREWAALHRTGALAAGGGDAADRPRVLVEHTSINPNKAAHVGHLRNACIGDTLARLFRRLRFQVEVCNYVDDLGNQVADTLVGLLDVPVAGDHRRFGDFCWDVYARVNQAYTTGAVAPARRAEVQHALEEGRTNVAWLGTVVAERLTREQLADMAAFGVAFDFLVWERDILRGGFWDAAAARLRQSPLFVKETDGRLAGCWVLKQPEAAQDAAAAPEADERTADKVLVRSNGLLTYTAKDIAYHLWKFGALAVDLRYTEFLPGVWTSSPHGVARPFGRADRVLNVIDYRQEYPQQMVRLALETLGLRREAANLDHVRYGVVTLSPETAARLGVDTSEGRASYPMSGRQGIGIKVADLLEQMEATVEAVRPRQEGIASRAVAAAALRYYLLRFNLLTEIVLDLEQAAALHGNSGVYLMYQHARCAKVLHDGGWPPSSGTTVPAIPGELLEAERTLLRLLSGWQDVLAQAAAELNPTLLATYAYDLASAHSRFYEAAPILRRDVPPAARAFRLWLVALTRETLADALATIGLPAPDAM